MAIGNSSATRRVTFEEETLEEWAIEISMAILREARQSRLKMCQILPFLSPHSISERLAGSINRATAAALNSAVYLLRVFFVMTFLQMVFEFNIWSGLAGQGHTFV